MGWRNEWNMQLATYKRAVSRPGAVGLGVILNLFELF